MKLCKDCKHFTPSSEWSTPELKNRYSTCALTDYVGAAELGERCIHRRQEVLWFRPYCGPKGLQFEKRVD